MQTFKAASMAEALVKVKQAFGADAVILGTRTVQAPGFAGVAGRNWIEVTAGPPEMHTPAPRLRAAPGHGSPLGPGTSAAPRPAVGNPRTPMPHHATVAPTRDAGGRLHAEISGRESEALRALRRKLATQEIAGQLANEILARAAEIGGSGVQASHLQRALRERIERLMPSAGGIIAPPAGQRRVALVGPPGAGKTTTLAKLATQLRLREGREVALLSLDLQNLSGNELLKRYGELIGVPVRLAQTVGAVKQALQATRSASILLIDTFGVAPRDRARFLRLAALLRAARPDETHLVAPATMTPDAQQRYREAYRPLEPTRLVLTRLDEALGLGVVLSAADLLRLEVSYTTHGPDVPHAIENACPRKLADALCREIA